MSITTNKSIEKFRKRVTRESLNSLVLKQVQSVVQFSHLDKIQVLSTRLDLADYENRRLRTRIGALERQFAAATEAMKTMTEKFGSQKRLLNQNIEAFEEGNLSSITKLCCASPMDKFEFESLPSLGREHIACEAENIRKLVLGGWGFEVTYPEIDAANETKSCTPRLPSALQVTPVKRRPVAATVSPPASVFLTPEVSSPTQDQPAARCVTPTTSVFLTPDPTPLHKKSSHVKSYKQPAPPNFTIPVKEEEEQVIINPYQNRSKQTSQVTSTIKQEVVPSNKSSPGTWRPSPVLLRKISVNQGKIAISWNLVKEIASLSEISEVSGYELYQASPVKMWQLVGTFPAMKLPIAVVMSSDKQQARYQLRLKIFFKDGRFVFSNILSFVA